MREDDRGTRRQGTGPRREEQPPGHVEFAGAGRLDDQKVDVVIFRHLQIILAS